MGLTIWSLRFVYLELSSYNVCLKTSLKIAMVSGTNGTHCIVGGSSSLSLAINTTCKVRNILERFQRIDFLLVQQRLAMGSVNIYRPVNDGHEMQVSSSPCCARVTPGGQVQVVCFGLLLLQSVCQNLQLKYPEFFRLPDPNLQTSMLTA